MSKIIVAMNAMIEFKEEITNVLKASSGEYFFLYKNKYKWSMSKSDSKVRLFFYPDDESLEQLAVADEFDWEQIDMVSYSSEDYRASEAVQTFFTLFNIVSEKAFGMDEVLDKIIQDMEIPF